jgi:predicted amino acid racemase
VWSIAPTEIPQGIDYQIVTKAVLGDERFGQVPEMEKNGWRRVPRSRHPNLKTVDPKWIEAGGLVLMERPLLLTQRAKEWEQAKADAQIVKAVQALETDYDTVRVLRSNGREVNAKATGKRKTTIREFATKHIWSGRHWLRTKFSKEYRR